MQVSLFLREKVQHNTGRFVLPVSGALPVDVEVPGNIRSALGRMLLVCVLCSDVVVVKTV